MFFEDKKYYMVREDVLPESIRKTAQAKEMLAKGEAMNIQEAVEKLDMARSTYYKYKDGVFAFFDAESLRIVNVSMLLKHQPGVLSGVLNAVAGLNANVLTINQNLPLHGVAHVTISISVEEMNVTIEELLRSLRNFDGIVEVEVVGKS